VTTSWYSVSAARGCRGHERRRQVRAIAEPSRPGITDPALRSSPIRRPGSRVDRLAEDHQPAGVERTSRLCGGGSVRHHDGAHPDRHCGTNEAAARAQRNADAQGVTTTAGKRTGSKPPATTAACTTATGAPHAWSLRCRWEFDRAAGDDTSSAPGVACHSRGYLPRRSPPGSTPRGSAGCAARRVPGALQAAAQQRLITATQAVRDHLRPPCLPGSASPKPT